MTSETKRFFVGGLFHGVSTQDIEERFSKFGKVSAVNIKTKLDSEGKPFKTFAHLSIEASAKDLKKCKALFILRKSMSEMHYNSS